MRTANRNNHLLLNFLERYVVSKEGGNYSLEELNQFTSKYITDEKVNKYFNKLPIHFGKWLLQRNDRTLEHSIEELFEMYYEQLITSSSDKQIDTEIPDLPYEFQHDTHAPNSCPL